MMIKVLVVLILCHQITTEDTGVHFWLYTKESILQNDYEVMNFDGENVILDENTKFDPSKPTKLVAHGNGGGLHIDYIFNQAYADAGFDFNVIGIDWRSLEGSARKRTDYAGNQTGRFLHGMVSNYGLNFSDVSAIGFSYGTHVIANTGKYALELGLNKITVGIGLDTVGNLGFHKAKHYFEYVIAIHTTAGKLGVTARRGHIDFYPNGGSIQPCTCSDQCPDVDCHQNWQQESSHKRAPALFEV